MDLDLDIENILQDEVFNPIEFANGVIKFNNNNDGDIDQLDLNTPIKKFNYDLTELENKIDELIKTNSVDILNQYYKRKNGNALIDQNLKPSLNYLDISFKRLNDEIISPYEKVTKLQNVLNKIHQTSNLLRDSLLLIHLINKISQLELNLTNVKELAVLHSQFDGIMNNNLNLMTLKLFKTLNASFITVRKTNILNFVTLKLTDNFGLNKKNSTSSASKQETTELSKEQLSNMFYSLYVLSVTDFTLILNKIIQSIVTSSVQQLAKTINSIKRLPILLEEQVLPNACFVYNIEILLKSISIEKENLTKTNTTASNGLSTRSSTNTSDLLMEFISLQRKKNTMNSAKTNKSLLQIYWSSVSSNFKKDFDITINRGGPVGKSLINNKEFIKKSINDTMKKQFKVEDGNDQATINFEEFTTIMQNSVLILSK